MLLLLWLGLAFMASLSSAWATPSQTPLDDAHILRGAFTQQIQIGLNQNPVISTGHFVAAPTHGLLWMMENPLPTTTVITPDAAVQNFGGMVIKLRAKNLAWLYTLVNAALAGHWSVLQNDFDITSGGDAQHWQKILTAKHDGNENKSRLPYLTVSVSGKNFVEDIVMTKSDGSNDAFHFTDENLSTGPLSLSESQQFERIHK